MATTETRGVMAYKDESGNLHVHYPVTEAELATYDPSSSGLSADNVQDALDELAGRGGGGLYPQLIVTGLTAGSTVKATCNGQEVTLTESSGTWTGNVPSFGVWTINATKGSSSASASVTVEEVKQYTVTMSYFSATINITAPSGSTVTVENANSTVVNTHSGTGSAVAVKVGAAGTYKVKAVSGSNTADGTATISSDGQTVSVSLSFISTTLNDNTWAKIGEVSLSGKGDLYWDVGDAKAGTFSGKVGDFLTLSGTKYTYIIDFNHVDGGVADNNIMWATFMSAQSGGVPTALVDSKYSPDANWANYTGGEKTFTMNHWGNYNYGGWAGCDLRYDILGATNTAPSGYGSQVTTSRVGYDATGNEFTSPKANTLLAAFPSDLRAVMRLREHWADSKGNSSNVEANVTKIKDAISLIMEFELFGARSYANQYEQNKQTQFAFWKNGGTKKFMKNSAVATEAQYVWLGSARYNYADDFCASCGGSASYAVAHHSLALVAAFKT